MENPSKNPPPAVSRAGASAPERAEGGSAQGRLDSGPPIAVIDIGSNSVRLVVYEGLTRSPTPLFNEKTLCGLGREVQSTGLLAAGCGRQGARRARRGSARCATRCRSSACGRSPLRRAATPRTARRSSPRPSASAAPRSTSCRASAKPSSRALGDRLRHPRPDGIVGDLGGGSLELVDVHGTRVRPGVTLPLGGLALQDMSAKSIKKAEKIVAQGAQRRARPRRRRRAQLLRHRRHLALARAAAHVADRLSAARHPRLRPAGARKCSSSRGWCIGSIPRRCRRSRSSPMRAGRCSPTAALVLEHVVRLAKPREVVVSALGVREGLLYSLLDSARSASRTRCSPRRASSISCARARPQHGEELIGWTDRFMASSGLDETAEEKRLRHAACLLADIGWRAHPGLSRRAVAQHHRARRLRRHRPPEPRLSGAGGVLPPRRAGRGRAVAAPARARHHPHARPRARPRRRHACRLSGVGRDAGRAAAHADGGRARQAGAAAARANSPRSRASGCSTGCKQLARLIGREPVMAVG